MVLARVGRRMLRQDHGLCSVTCFGPQAKFACSDVSNLVVEAKDGLEALERYHALRSEVMQLDVSLETKLMRQRVASRMSWLTRHCPSRHEGGVRAPRARLDRRVKGLGATWTPAQVPLRAAGEHGTSSNSMD
jgi:hypothetical protein